MSVIVNSKQVSEWLEEGTVVFADCRFSLQDTKAGVRAYEEGHIPGAVYVDLERDLSAPIREGGHGGRHPLPEPAAIAEVLGRLGIGRDTNLVVYDDQGGAMAARLIWLLGWLGHEGKVSLLDGGYTAWVNAGYPTSSELSQLSPAKYVPEIQTEWVVDAAGVTERFGRSGVVLIDSREAARYRGEVEPIDSAAGHIPGAVNHFWKESLTPEGTWLSQDEQRARFSSISLEDEIIVYCGSGVTATPNVIALKEAGFRNVKLYAGSWSDWISYAENPIATGEE